jgi:hypothetical protein
MHSYGGDAQKFGETESIHRVALRPELSLNISQVWETSCLLVARTSSYAFVVEGHVTDFSTCGGLAKPDQRCRYCMLRNSLVCRKDKRLQIKQLNVGMEQNQGGSWERKAERTTVAPRGNKLTISRLELATLRPFYYATSSTHCTTPKACCA